MTYKEYLAEVQKVAQEIAESKGATVIWDSVSIQQIKAAAETKGGNK